ncbi:MULTISPECIES: ectoine/hydroxyectoine ABC transporter substrate-binding protein EhuB [Desulfococcus]|jgi:polar amino acid transport system substrate-binding protein|uniref:Ectoine/hydroxyectoine ABC transporter solute-binding protein n=1 Tax=Desulfococcus multivorans DSM 2059 TaxID=1121405 RepID=S7V3T3_DESML|nr:ectoine/hydroxyectoine ABC transporter substrate-binding protein EhuB [Desulfococcus multivorans]AQU99922.1 ectoine/hydroxyectoine ABC transporter substrate-binding protein EhuB [Desulfococcus multivorans]EPR39328.1 ectoine/hydroxyectoine ABC transporter solute-binding protein [Desulfococcus multivorans DSM 2059]SKA12792.1 amino acid ABC transporter substrate-binding protein, PAAT family (TC 3.A.1.3.-) [Desulfococcus multivorans DSM 2059]
MMFATAPRRRLSFLAILTILSTFVLSGITTAAHADEIMDRVNSGKSIRIGFANEVPWAYPGENQKPLGFVNAITMGVLKSMGYTNIEPVVTDWGGLIPGLKANRFDVITGGMYIMKNRCDNVNFSEPIGVFGECFIVPKGNPKGLGSYDDIKTKNAVIVTGAGYSTIENAKRAGVPAGNIMTVPGNSEILAAIKAGRADAGGMTYFSALHLSRESGGTVEATDPSLNPEWTFNWVGVGFRKADTEFLAAFNTALKAYLGSDEMMKAVQEYGYGNSQLPGDVTTAYVCENR